MDLSEHAGDLAFRQEVQDFLAQHLPASLRAKGLALEKPGKDELAQWHRILCRRGWGGPAWPVQFGGTGWPVMHQIIFEEECTLAGAPRFMPQINMIGPVLHRFGTPAQQQRFLPRMLTLEDWWCQGYSEPEAGSDLTSLRTRARRVGDHYIVTGQKIWTSGAPWADWMFALVRTSDEGRPAEGISFLMLDMKSPGVEARWIRGFDGGGTLAEVFLNDVRVPVENLVHQENQGWTVAKHLLGFERTGQAAVGNCKLLLKLLKQMAARLVACNNGYALDAARRSRIAALQAELIAHEWTFMRLLSTPSQPPAFSMLKNRGAEIQQGLIQLMLECAGDDLARPGVASGADTLPGADAIAAAYLDLRKVSIFAGTTEVQKNIIGKALLA